MKMGATTTPTTPTTGTAPAVELKLRPNRLFTIVAIAALIVGIASILGGLGGAVYTYQQAAVENIITPEDAAIAEAPVRGPLTMWAQSDIITQHQLERTEGLRYAEMEREAPVLDEAGEPVLDDAGEPVMGPNTARLSWLDATTLTSVLGLGILAYAFSAFAVAVGVILTGMGMIVLALRRDAVAFA